MYEVFIGKNKQGRDKKYLVATLSKKVNKELDEFINEAIKFFKVRPKNLYLTRGWTVGEDLYFRNPKTKGQRKVWVITYISIYR